jgi:hypothetical protein
MSAEPISAPPPSTPATLGSAAVQQAPTVNLKWSDLQLFAGKVVDSSEIREIRQALSELLALKEGVGSNQQIQEKKATLKAAVERGVKKDPKSVLKFLFGFTQISENRHGIEIISEIRSSFVQRDPELAIALLDQAPNEFGRSCLANAIGSEWAASDLKAAFAWANQQTDSKIKSAILEGVISSWAKTDLQGAFAYAQSLPPGDSQDSTIRDVFKKAAQGDQGALAMMQSLSAGRTKDLAAEGISFYMTLNDPRAAWDLASGIADSGLRSIAEQRVLIQLGFGSLTDPDVATQWMQSLPEGKTKDMLSKIISGQMSRNHPQVAFDIASGIGNSDLRTTALKYVVEQWSIVEQWSKKDPAAATQWINSSSLPQEVKTQLLGLAASNAPAQTPTPSQPPGYVDEAPLPKGWPKPGPYDQVSEKSYPSYRAAFTTENRENGAFRTLFSHLQKNDIPMTAPVEISMAEGDGQNLRQTSLAFLYQDTTVGKTGADGAKIEVRDVPAMKTLSYTWQGDRNEANIAKAKAALEAALKDRKTEAKGFRLLGYNGPGVPELKRTWELQAILSTSALATSPVPTSGSAPQPPTVDVEKQKLQPAAGEKFDPSEIRQALSELLALKEGVGSIEQIQEKKATLKAAVERGIKKYPKSVIKLLFGFEQFISKRGTSSSGPYITDEVRSFIQRDPELAIALLDEVPNEFGRSILVNSIGSTWAESDLKAALAWANQQTDSKIKNKIIVGVISIWAKTNFEAALAYVQSLPPGASQDGLISLAFSQAAFKANSVQGAIAMMQSLPAGRTKDLAASGISSSMSQAPTTAEPQAAMDIATGIGDSEMRTNAQANVILRWFARDRAAAMQCMQSLPVGPTRDLAAMYIASDLSMRKIEDRPAAVNMASGIGDTKMRTDTLKIAVQFWYRVDPAASIQWMQTLPVGPTKDSAVIGISLGKSYADPQAAMNMASGIADSDIRTEAQEEIVEEWSMKDPAAVTQWINSSSLPQDVKTQLLAKTQLLPENPLPLPIIVPPSRRR